MKKKQFLLLLLVCCFGEMAFAQISIIPQPQDIKLLQQPAFVYDYTVLLVENTDNVSLKAEKSHLLEFAESQSLRLSSVDASQKNGEASLKNKKTITLSLVEKDPALTEKEAYLLDIDANSIRIRAVHRSGIWNGMQSLKQMILIALAQQSVCDKDKFIALPALSIHDYPSFEWRGLMLDVSRNFFNKQQVMQYIDLMALYKFNVFHWHLSDDQGWRLEIKAYPKLTQIGAWRVERHGFFGERKAPTTEEPATYGGYYTQQEVKEIVEYAKQRNITIVPEIDIPGHSSALLAAYPELSTTGEKLQVSPGHKFANWFTKDGKTTFEMLTDNTLDPTNEEVYTFIKKVMQEIASLFPGTYIHMGGDECYHGYWEKSEKTKAFMNKHGIKNTEELQSYFVHRVNKIIRSVGKQMIGWDEILDGGELDKHSAVMSWRGTEGGIKASQSDHKVVMSPTTYAYLDYTQGDPSWETKIYHDLSLRKSFEFSPVPVGAKKEFILGGQGNLWTEQVHSLQHAFYMTYPRAFSIIEKVWNNNDSLSWDAFFHKVETQFKVFDWNKKSICKTIYEPIVNAYFAGNDSTLYLGATTDIPSEEGHSVTIRYTIDNTFPTMESNYLVSDIVLPEGDYRVRLQTYRNGNPIGRLLSIHRSELVERAKKTKK